jgi:hypothetical protein
MDSKYIAMCKEATEIQDLWVPKSGDQVIRHLTVFGEELDKQIWNSMDTFEILVNTSMIEGYWHCTNKNGDSITLTNEEMHKQTCMWIPRQEDLQTIIRGKLPSGVHETIYLLDCFNAWYCDKSWAFSYNLNLTISELWLHFVMEKMFKKTWNTETSEWAPIK